MHSNLRHAYKLLLVVVFLAGCSRKPKLTPEFLEARWVVTAQTDKAPVYTYKEIPPGEWVLQFDKDGGFISERNGNMHNGSYRIESSSNKPVLVLTLTSDHLYTVTKLTDEVLVIENVQEKMVLKPE